MVYRRRPHKSRSAAGMSALIRRPEGAAFLRPRPYWQATSPFPSPSRCPFVFPHRCADVAGEFIMYDFSARISGYLEFRLKDPLEAWDMIVYTSVNMLNPIVGCFSTCHASPARDFAVCCAGAGSMGVGARGGWPLIEK